jgi:hypothetical protein
VSKKCEKALSAPIIAQPTQEKKEKTVKLPKSEVLVQKDAVDQHVKPKIESE